MNKKALIFLPLVVIGTLIVLSYAYYSLVLHKVTLRGDVGSLAVEVFEINQDAEEINFYIEKANLYVTYNSIHELGENGGYYDSKCGNHNEYNFWVNKDENCYPKIDDLKNNFKLIYEENFDNYSLPDRSRLSFKDAYRVNVEDNLNVSVIEQKPYYAVMLVGFNIGNYTMNHSSSAYVNYSFSDYIEIEQKVDDPITLCKNAECINRMLDKGDYKWEIWDEQNLILFNVNTTKKIFNDFVVIKFAVKK